ncbi:MAG: glycosyltransferase [Vicinamibacterales bacterium]
MRVLLATNSTDRGSTSRTMEAWVRRLPSHGVEPLVAIGGEGPLYDALRTAGVPVHVHRIRQFFTGSGRLPFLMETARLAARIRASRVDLVHVNEHEHYQVPARAAWLAGVPAVVHVRFRPDAAMCQWLFKPPCTPRRVFFTSHTQMQDCQDAVATAVSRDRFRLVYNGLNKDTFGRDTSARQRLRAEWHLNPRTIVVGTASSISPRKRLDHFIRAVHAMALSGLDVRAFIAGQPYFGEDRTELSHLQALVRELDLDSRLTFLGYVEPVEPLYHAWDICVSTSEYETFGMTMLEAMACGCPVVAYPGGSVAEVIADGGEIVQDGDLVGLSSALSRLAADETLRSARAEAARLRAGAFDVKRSAEQLAMEYAAVLDECRRRE